MTDAPIESLSEAKFEWAKPLGVSDEVKAALDADLDPARVKQLRGNDYLPTHDVKRTANRIFGFGKWGHEVVELICVGSTEKTSNDGKKGVYVGYRCTVRLTVDGCVPVCGVGYGDGVEYQEQSAVTAHELAVKEAESDALKRAFTNFGDQFGLILYAKADDKKRIAAEKDEAAYAVPASEADVAKAMTLATAKGKLEDVVPLLQAERAEFDNNVRSGRLQAIVAKLTALPDVNAAEADEPTGDGLEATVEQGETMTEQQADDHGLIPLAEGDREATADEVASLISLAGTIDTDAAAATTEAILKHRAKMAGGVVAYGWLLQMVEAIKKKIAATPAAESASAFTAPESATREASDDEVAAAFAEETAA